MGRLCPVALLALSACVGEVVNVLDVREVAVELTLSGLRTLDPDIEGTYEAWGIDPAGTIVQAGRFRLPSEGSVNLTWRGDVDPQHLMITVEPPGDMDSRPSPHKLLGGRFDGTSAVLGVTRYVTVGIPLEPRPGTHVLATPTDDADNGYPSGEDGGLWLYNASGDTLDGSYYLDFTPLTEGWRYEGWIVRNYGAPDALWISYGKFRPDGFRQTNQRDDTGLGFFSGRLDHEFALALQVRVPGDDWLDNPLDYPVPGGLTLPLDLNGDANRGVTSEWTHVITIEPWGPNRDPEVPGANRPFFLQPYRNVIGEAPPNEPRVIEYFPELLPTGTATIRPTSH